MQCAALLPEAPRNGHRVHCDPLAALGGDGIRILIDATADAGTAARHAAALSAGIHVATACKLAAGTSTNWRNRKIGTTVTTRARG